MDKIIEINKKPDQYDLAILFTIPFMTDDEEKQKELIFKTVKMALKLNIDDKNLWIDIGNNQILLAQTVLCAEEFLNYMEMVKMLDKDDVYNIAMYIKQAKEELAWKEGRGSIISNILSNGLSLEETSRLTGLSVEEVSELSKSK